MTGIKGLNYQAFNDMARRLEKLGFTPLNPASMPPGLDYQTYMQLDLVLVNACDCVLLLDGHEHSNGARAEMALAISLGKPCIEAAALNNSELKRTICSSLLNMAA
jgi:nucleoside 2-deoxyribosyltransferase